MNTPSKGSKILAMALSKVDFPQPLGPSERYNFPIRQIKVNIFNNGFGIDNQPLNR